MSRSEAAAAVKLYGEHPAMPYVDLAAEVAAEVRPLRAIEAELASHAGQREIETDRKGRPRQISG